MLFSGAASDSDGQLVQWRILFGDGTEPWVGTAAPVSVPHQYETAGRFVARLVVSDDGGTTATVTQTVAATTHPNEPPEAALAVPPVVGEAPLAITASDDGSTDPDGTVVQYAIDFEGDGAPEWSGPAPPFDVAHEYAIPGDYLVVLTVEDDEGAPASTSRAVSVTPPPALAVSKSGVDFGGSARSTTFDTTNAGGGDLNWTCTPSTTWITVSPTSGTNGGTVTVTVDRSALDGGTHTGSVAVSSNGGSTIFSVSLSMGGAQLDVTPTSLHLLEADSSATLRIANTGGGVLSFDCQASAAWLSASPATGTGAATITLTPDRSALSAGTHAATVSVTSDGGATDVSVLVDVAMGRLGLVIE